MPELLDQVDGEIERLTGDGACDTSGIELTGPGGDGFFSVVTPTSPVGRAVLGQEVGDTFDITVDGDARSWEITWAA